MVTYISDVTRRLVSMIRTACLFLVLLQLSFGCIASDEVSKQFIGSVPKEVYRLMLERECSPIEGFYDRYITLPPFVYHSHLFDGDGAIIFVCEIDEPVADDRYKIVLVRKSYSDNGVVYSDYEECDSEIYFRNMPGGLSIRLPDGPLELDYNLWEHSKNYIWDQTQLPSDISEGVPWLIEEWYGGAGSGLFCAEGNWYNVAYD